MRSRRKAVSVATVGVILTSLVFVFGNGFCATWWKERGNAAAASHAAQIDELRDTDKALRAADAALRDAGAALRTDHSLLEQRVGAVERAHEKDNQLLLDMRNLLQGTSSDIEWLKKAEQLRQQEAARRATEERRRRAPTP